MELIETEAKAPAQGVVGRVMSGRSVAIRAARWQPAPRTVNGAAPRGTVVVCTGRSEFIEKYYEVIEELRGRGFAVVAFDWRGQGLSDRQLRNGRKGHVWSFAEFEQDLEAVRRQVLDPFCPKPWFALAHSMGGPIALAFSARHPEVFQRIVLSAPMIDIARLPMPSLSRLLARWMCRAGLGRVLVPVGGNRRLFLSTFAGNVLTSDERRFDRTASLVQAEPGLTVGPPTFGWMNAAFDCVDAIARERFVNDFVTPTLVVMPGADVVVDGRAAERLALRLRNASLVSVPGARHEVLMERDTLRQQFWAAFDAFIPGSGSRPAAASADTPLRATIAAAPVP